MLLYSDIKHEMLVGCGSSAGKQRSGGLPQEFIRWNVGKCAILKQKITCFVIEIYVEKEKLFHPLCLIEF